LDAFKPFTLGEFSDQAIPTLIIQLNQVVDKVTSTGKTKELLGKKRQVASLDWTGQFISYKNIPSMEFWIGLHFGLWKRLGKTPLWLVFYPKPWGRGDEVKQLLEPWAKAESISTFTDNEENFCLAIELPVNEDRDVVEESLTSLLKLVQTKLMDLDRIA